MASIFVAAARLDIALWGHDWFHEASAYRSLGVIKVFIEKEPRFGAKMTPDTFGGYPVYVEEVHHERAIWKGKGDFQKRVVAVAEMADKERVAEEEYAVLLAEYKVARKKFDETIGCDPNKSFFCKSSQCPHSPDLPDHMRALPKTAQMDAELDEALKDL